MPSEAIGQYRILSIIGSGGMGDVFLAEDTRLGRRVAIKRVRAGALDPQAHRRLLTEAQATARLDHPNICGVHEVGEDDSGPYIVMPFVQGETLAARLSQGPLLIDDVIATAAQIADALGAAHGQHILHRDIKPANIMIDTRGLVRVMDFGLAKFTAAASMTTDATATALTDLGSTLGTAAYMSPEQARARPTDERSDLFSLGAVIHEMVTGQRAFAGPTIADTIVSVLGHHPPPLTRERADAPAELERIVSKLLKKNRDERYQSSADLLVDLRALARRGQETPAPPAPVARRSRWTAVAAIGIVVLLGAAGYAWWNSQRPTSLVPAAVAPTITSLAVLPLTNVSPDAGQEYFVAALTDELSRALSGITSLRVTSRTSTAQFKDTKMSMPDIAAALGVDGLIEGSVVRDGEHVRINAKLVHGPSDRTLWTESYDGELRGVLDLQRRVAEAIAVEVRATITPDEQQSLRATRAINPAAMELYLKGRESLYRGNSTAAGFVPEALLSALETFNAALTLEPDWAEPHSGVAAANHWLASGGFDPHVRFAAARDAAVRAISLDEREGDAHGALAYVSFAYFWDLDRSEREYARAIQLGAGPNHFIGYSKLLQALGRFTEAEAAMDQAISRNPLSAVFRFERAKLSLMSKKPDDAIARAADIPQSAANTRHQVISQAFLLNKQPEQAIAELKQASVPFLGQTAVALAQAGRRTEARKQLVEFEKKVNEDAVKSGADQVTLAEIYLSLGDRRRALDALDRAYAEKALWLPLINVNPAFDELRTEPRFKALLQRLGFPASR